MQEVEGNPLMRAARLAALPMGIAGRTALGIGKRVGGKSAELVASEMQARTAAQLFSVLGELKGGAMKFGQSLSMFEAAMPEELAGPYRATLTKLQDSAPALPVSTVHAVLSAELGDQWRTILPDFDDTPVAAASIGQVHRARWRDPALKRGHRADDLIPVAVKIQYPGAGKALLSDLRQISRVARVATSWIPGIEIGPLLTELRERMAEELDYRLEAEAQRAFALGYADDPNVFVPRVLTGTEHVIVTQWCDGTPLSTVISEGTQAQRDAASERYLDFLIGGPSRVGLLHADPHPGNFRIAPDGRLGVLDFGAVKRLPGGLPVGMGTLLRIALNGDADATMAGLREIGFLRPGIEVDAEPLLVYLEPFLAPARTETFTFSRQWLRETFAHVKDPRKANYDVGMRLNLPPEYLMIHRVWIGGIAVLSQIGGTVHGRAAVERNVPGFRDPDVPATGSRDDLV